MLHQLSNCSAKPALLQPLHRLLVSLVATQQQAADPGGGEPVLYMNSRINIISAALLRADLRPPRPLTIRTRALHGCACCSARAQGLHRPAHVHCAPPLP